MTEKNIDIFDEYLQEKEMTGKTPEVSVSLKWPACGVTSAKLLATLIIVLFFAPIYPDPVGRFESQFDQLRLNKPTESIHIIYYFVSGISILLISTIKKWDRRVWFILFGIVGLIITKENLGLLATTFSLIYFIKGTAIHFDKWGPAINGLAGVFAFLMLIVLITSLFGRTKKENQLLKNITRWTSVGILILGVLSFIKGQGTLIHLLNGKIPTLPNQPNSIVFLLPFFLSMLPEIIAIFGLLSTFSISKNEQIAKITYFFGFAFLIIPFIIIAYQAVETILQIENLFFSPNSPKQYLDISQDPEKQVMLQNASILLSRLRVAAYGLLMYFGLKISVTKYVEENMVSSEKNDHKKNNKGIQE